MYYNIALFEALQLNLNLRLIKIKNIILFSGACKGSTEPAQDTASGSWYSLKPQQISPPIPNADNGRGAWYAANPVPVVAQAPTTVMPILKGRHTGGNG